MMLNGYRGGVLDATPNINKFESKSEALKFAIEFTADYTEDGTRKANLTAAQELFDFICKNVELPDVRPNPADGLVDFAKEYIRKLAKDKEINL